MARGRAEFERGEYISLDDLLNDVQTGRRRNWPITRVSSSCRARRPRGWRRPSTIVLSGGGRRARQRGRWRTIARVIELPGAPPQMMTKALVDRGLTWVQKDDLDRALADYTRAIEMADAPVEEVAR